MGTEPVEEFCKNDKAPMVRECPDCIDKFILLARQYEAENVKLHKLICEGGAKMYVIIRNDGKFVSLPGAARSYTSDMQKARTFLTREAAERERCPENERVVSVFDLLRDAG